MKTIRKGLRKLDQFGVVFSPYVRKDDKKFKTSIGGVISVILYSVALTYFIYVMY
jgi:hypothetical protein